MKRRTKLILGALVLAGSAVGCDNIGNAPSGGDTKQVEANFAALPPEQQIQTIQLSPASPEKKAELIKAIQDKYHISAGAAPVQGKTQSNTAAPPKTGG